MPHVLSPHAGAPLADPGFWAGRWRGRFDPGAPAVVNPRLAERSRALWDPLELGPVAPAALGEWIEAARVPDAWWAVLDGRPSDEAARAQLRARLNLEGLRPFKADRYGLTLGRANLRALPTAARGHKTNDEDGFDRLQHTALEPLTPLALLHPSRDGAWWFVQAPDYRGWIRARELAWTELPGEIANLLAQPGPVLLSPTAELETACGATLLQMGSRLPGLRGGMLAYPARDEHGQLLWSKARLRGAPELAPEPPPLTPEAFFARALAPLGRPYGWGGLTPEGPGLDCSRFVQDVFKVFGYRLPRDASAQCAATRPAIAFDAGEPHEARARKLAELDAGPALLCMPGHVMLYLGSVDGCHHAAHAFWAYKRRENGGEVTVPVRRVVVTSLDLGRGTDAGSLLERLTSVNLL
ncbi:SH3 domain-containing protein [Oceanithermus desulfurans]|uniref:NlpC/P60 domain-containing protein n=2 Tax=Oceanithermus desulfurans TaxID=227924 RepID=A0A511RIK7_9DEIN|nr:SH3 domain-containing protein [Oceanithermus desulfurans]MBB6030644.1 hypothetical protein [Oceanithermus desulfurans]GEM89478.1 hypothetical protein ODE01S_09120 [Oceanithermus desulfurans NBRC 100063]